MRIFNREAQETPVQQISVQELERRLGRGERIAVVDVRQPSGYDAFPGEIPGSMRIPPAELPARYEDLPRDRPIVLYCT